MDKASRGTIYHEKPCYAFGLSLSAAGAHGHAREFHGRPGGQILPAVRAPGGADRCAAPFERRRDHGARGHFRHDGPYEGCKISRGFLEISLWHLLTNSRLFYGSSG
jgi:hypothetical protein